MFCRCVCIGRPLPHTVTETCAGVIAKNPTNRQRRENNLVLRDPAFGRISPDFWSFAVLLARNYIGRTGPLLALSDLELDLLAFVERCIASSLDFRVVDKQILAAVIRDYEAKSLA